MAARVLAWSRGQWTGFPFQFQPCTGNSSRIVTAAGRTYTRRPSDLLAGQGRVLVSWFYWSKKQKKMSFLLFLLFLFFSVTLSSRPLWFSRAKETLLLLLLYLFLFPSKNKSVRTFGRWLVGWATCFSLFVQGNWMIKRRTVGLWRVSPRSFRLKRENLVSLLICYFERRAEEKSSCGL